MPGIRKRAALWLCLFALFSIPAFAVCPDATNNAIYFGATATGTGLGTDWGNLATLSASALLRPCVNWIPLGTYAGMTITTPDSGTTPLVIQAATIAAHGTTTGWSNSFQGQAVFGPILIQTDYVTWNGVYRGNGTGSPWLDWRTNYGFKVVNNNGLGVPINAAGAIIVGIGGSNQPQNGVQIEYTEVDGSCDLTGTYTDMGINFTGGSSTGNYAGHNYVNCVGNAIAIAGDSINSATIERNWIKNNGTTTILHAEGIGIRCWNGGTATNITIRYNFIENINGTASIATPCAPGNIRPGNWAIYGNVMLYNASEVQAGYSCTSPTQCGMGDGWLEINNFTTFTGYLYVFNNTISNIDQPGGNCGHDWSGVSSPTMGTVAIYNNVYYNCKNTVTPPGCPGTCSSYHEDYNSFFDTATTDTAPNVQTSSTNPFVNVAQTINANNFSLATDTAGWFNTASLVTGNSTDLLGNTRTSSRGALQYQAATASHLSTVLQPGAHLSTVLQSGATLVFGGQISLCLPPNYCANTSVGIVPWPATIPNVGGVLKNGTPVTDTSLGSLNRVSRCTDQAIVPAAQAAALGNQTKFPGLGGSGDAVQLFNAASPPTLIEFNASGGSNLISPFVAATMTCTGAITAAANLTNPGSANTAYNFGGGSFDWTNPLIYYAFGDGVDAPPNGVAQYTFNSSNQFTVTSPILDFTYGLPFGNLAPAWQASHAYANGDYVSYTFTEPDWTPSNAYATLGTIIQPTVNNPLNCAFKLTVAGTSTTSGSEPTWSTLVQGVCNPPSNGQITDGTAKWRNLGGGASFTFQLTSSGGTSGGSTPGFTPNFNTPTSDNGLTWTNTGLNASPPWQSFAGISQDSTRYCSAFSTNGYGNTGNYNNYNGDQGTGVYASCYSNTLNQFFLLNTLTGIQSTVTCVGGTGYNCAGGTQSKLTAQGTVSAIASQPCPYFIHNDKGSVGLDYTTVANQGPIPGGSGSCIGAPVVWTAFATFNATTSAQLYPFKLNHWAMMNTHVVNLGQNTGYNGGFASGAYTQFIPLNNPGGMPAITWQVGSPWTNPCDINGVWFPNDPNPPCDLANAYDSHFGSAFNPGGADTAPVCGTIYNYATLAPPPVAAYQGEEVCVSTNPSWTFGSPIPQYTVWRFTHNFNSGGNIDFDIQFSISQMSNDGKYLAFGSDWWNPATQTCTLGSVTGTSSSLCGVPWVAGTAYAVGNMVNPFSSTGGAGTNYGVYEITTAGTAAASAPSWFVCNSGTIGNTITDSNGVVYTCQGTSTAKGEVFIVELSP